MAEAAPSFLSETPAETAEFESVREGTAPEAEPSPEPEARPAVEPKPVEVKAEPKVDPANDPNRPKGFVPNQALKEERERRQAVERELAELRAGRVAPAVEKPAPIDPDTDPIAALKEIRDYQQKQREEGERNNQIRAFDQRVQAHEKDFSDATPDYGDAVTFLREARAKQIIAGYEAVGQQITQAQLGAMLLHEARTTSNGALENGRNPGEVFYTLAKSFGYAPKGTELVPIPALETPAVPEVLPAVLPTKEASEKIARLTRGHAASAKTGGGEAPASGEVTLESLANLEGAAFDAAFNKFTATQKRAERH